MSLIEDAKAAKEAGISYGQYMLRSREFVSFKKPKGPRCEICGGPLIGQRRRFCSKECRDEAKLRLSRGDKFV